MPLLNGSNNMRVQTQLRLTEEETKQIDENSERWDWYKRYMFNAFGNELSIKYSLKDLMTDSTDDRHHGNKTFKIDLHVYETDTLQEIFLNLKNLQYALSRSEGNEYQLELVQQIAELLNDKK